MPIENKKLAISNKICDMKQHKFCAANVKIYHERKNILGDFNTFNFCIVLLAAQINRKRESDTDFSGRL